MYRGPEYYDTRERVEGRCERWRVEGRCERRTTRTSKDLRVIEDRGPTREVSLKKDSGSRP